MHISWTAGRNVGRVGLLAGLAGVHAGLVTGWDVGRAELVARRVFSRGQWLVGRNDGRARRLAGWEGIHAEWVAGQVGR